MTSIKMKYITCEYTTCGESNVDISLPENAIVVVLAHYMLYLMLVEIRGDSSHKNRLSISYSML